MAKTLEDLRRLLDVDPAKVAEAKEQLLARQRAYQLAELRRTRGMTQKALASEMHVGQSRVSQIESGQMDRARLETLKKYAKALGGTLRVEVEVGDSIFTIA